MRRPWIVLVLIGLALVGAVLIRTADDDDRVALEEVTTAEGLVTQIPEGWVVADQFPFEFGPPGDGQVFDQWTVARACPTDGCDARTLEEWLALAPDLPTFTNLEAVEGEDTFNLRVETLVAAFTDGSDDYVACSVRLGLDADQRLADEIVEVCRSTRVAA